MQLVAGIDEAGRGCLAGPVVAATVILPRQYPPGLLRDSKLMTARQRETAYLWIIAHCHCGIGAASHAEIDAIGIKPATHLAMRRALAALPARPDLLRIDGCDHFAFDLPAEEYIRGDSRFAEIAAASIVAKVTRDRQMQALALEYPEFGFERHKGYGVKTHLELVMQGRYSAIHRLSFDPLRSLLAGIEPFA